MGSLYPPKRWARNRNQGPALSRRVATTVMDVFRWRTDPILEAHPRSGIFLEILPNLGRGDGGIRGALGTKGSIQQQRGADYGGTERPNPKRWAGNRHPARTGRQRRREPPKVRVLSTTRSPALWEGGTRQSHIARALRYGSAWRSRGSNPLRQVWRYLPLSPPCGPACAFPLTAPRCAPYLRIGRTKVQPTGTP